MTKDRTTEELQWIKEYALEQPEVKGSFFVGVFWATIFSAIVGLIGWNLYLYVTTPAKVIVLGG